MQQNVHMVEIFTGSVDLFDIIKNHYSHRLKPSQNEAGLQPLQYSLCLHMMTTSYFCENKRGLLSLHFECDLFSDKCKVWRSTHIPWSVSLY